MRSFILALAFIGIASVASAQSVDSIKQLTTFKVAADHDGLDTDGYRVYLNGGLWQTVPVASLVAGVVTFDFPTGLIKGTYVIYVEAFSTAGAASSTTVTLTVTSGNPTPPRNPRIVK